MDSWKFPYPAGDIENWANMTWIYTIESKKYARIPIIWVGTCLGEPSLIKMYKYLDIGITDFAKMSGDMKNANFVLYWENDPYTFITN